jgi:RND family efflux transporter MFP subunit
MKRYFLFSLITLAIVSCKNNERSMSRDISIPVSIITVEKGDIEQYLSITGTITPCKEAIKKTEIEGLYHLATNPITNKAFSPGDKVKKGEVIVRLKNKEYENNIKISSLKLQLEISKQTFKKQESLYKKGGVTLSDYKNSEVSLINAEYSYEDAKIRLGKMAITAPFDGVLVNIPHHTDNTKIDAGQEAFKIMDYESLMMEINLAEKNINQISKNQAVKVTNYTLPNDTLIGKITQISPIIDPETRSFKVMVSINNKQLLLRPGMFAKGEIIVASIKNTIIIPKDVVLSKHRGYRVFVVNKGYAQSRTVKFGLENPEKVQIIEGLKVNDQLVVKGFETLTRHSKVKIVK